MMMMVVVVQFLHLYCAALTAQTVTSAQSNHAHRPNGTATFSVCVGIVGVSGLRHGTIELVSSNLLAPTLQNCVVRTLTFWFAGQPDHCGLRNVSPLMLPISRLCGLK